MRLGLTFQKLRLPPGKGREVDKSCSESENLDVTSKVSTDHSSLLLVWFGDRTGFAIDNVRSVPARPQKHQWGDHRGIRLAPSGPEKCSPVLALQIQGLFRLL